ncbi:MAG TPA: AarF/UbiB family protein [Polyangiales bacterium]|nr:AarF/UbiB family protein [Polyangiales bacterium]
MAFLLDTVRDLGRLREIAGVLARHGFGELLTRTGLASLVPGKNAESSEPRLAVRARRVLEELGPSFVKLGQLLSTRPDLLPADMIEELKRLQDDVPPLPFAEMKPEIERELGATIPEIFSSFDERPLASASIGQVYHAMLRSDDGEAAVVVKVQRPSVGPTIDRDIDLLYWFARVLERSVPETGVYRPVRLVEEFDRAIRAELDFAQEADNAERFAHNFADLPTVRFPRVYREYSSRKAITMGYFEGENIFDAVQHGASAERIAKNAVQIVVKMVFEHGFFHADPHPGNILILGSPEAPILGLVDLGLVGRLSPRLRDRLVDLVVAAGTRDSRAIADALYSIGKPTKKVDRMAFEAEVARLSDKYLGRRLGDVPFSDLIRDLANASLRYGMETPPDLLMVGKAVMTVEGIARQIYPALDIVEEMRPYFTEIVGYRYSPERLTSDMLHIATRFANAATEFPARAEDILEDLRHGRMSVDVRQTSLMRATERLGKRIFSGLVVAALVLAGALLVARGYAAYGGALFGVAAVWTGVMAATLALGRGRPD